MTSKAITSVAQDDAFFRCLPCGSTLFLLSPSGSGQWLVTCKDCASSYELRPSGSIHLVRHGAELAAKKA